MLTPPTPEIVNGWVALLTPLAVAVLTVVNVIIAKLAAVRGAKVERATHEVRETLVAQNVARAEVNKQAQDAVLEVKETLASGANNTNEKLQSLQHIANDTHTLVNNNMAIQLKINAVKSRKLADLTHDGVDIAEAEEAERALIIHLNKQARVDMAVEDRKE